MNTLDQACDYFRAWHDHESLAARYVFYLPRRGISLVGLGCHQTIRVWRDNVAVHTEGGVTHHALSEPPFDCLRGRLDPRFPAFLLVSPDLARGAQDPDLPLMLCIQPKLEVSFTGVGAQPQAALIPPAGRTGEWQTQSDADFRDRLAWAIEALQAHPVGKMIITRAYRKAVGARDRLALFEGFARTEPVAACSHFLRLGEHLHSLGCSPENLFEIDDSRVAFDVVAGTRGVSPDPVVDQRWLAALQSDPKEQREHLMAFDRYLARMETLVEPGSLSVDHKLQVLQLGRVRHLYSRLSGQLKPGLDALRLLADSFPPLTSYPAELAALADLPTEPNRYYGGVVGRIAPGGQQAAFFLNIRAALVKQSELHTLGGVGVIAESEPDKELLEVKNKLSGLMSAIAAWEHLTDAK